MAVEHAHRVLGWQENLSEEEMPPEWMWTLDEELQVWFDEVQRARDEKYGGGESSNDEVPMMQNELAARFKGR